MNMMTHVKGEFMRIKVIDLEAMTSASVATTFGEAGRRTKCAYSTPHQARHDKI